MKPVYSNLISNEIIMDGDYYYAINGIGNKLYKINVDNLKIEACCEINTDRDQNYLLYMSGVRYGNEIYYAPHTAKSIGIYSIHNNSMRSIEFENLNANESLGMVTGRYTYSFAHNDSIFFLGFNVPTVMKLDLKTGEITYIPVPEEAKDQYNGWGYFSQGVINIKKDRFLLPMGCKGRMLCLDAVGETLELADTLFCLSGN